MSVGRMEMYIIIYMYVSLPLPCPTDPVWSMRRPSGDSLATAKETQVFLAPPPSSPTSTSMGCSCTWPGGFYCLWVHCSADTTSGRGLAGLYCTSFAK